MIYGDNMSSNEFIFDDVVEKLAKNKDDSIVINILKEMFDYDQINIDPLTEIPESKMRLYNCFCIFNSPYFDSLEELKEWVLDNNIKYDDVCTIDYLGEVAGQSDVFRKTFKNGKEFLYTACDEDGYGIYNYDKSFSKGRFIWDYTFGDIKDMYDAFRNKGIIFKNDIYLKKEENTKKLSRNKKIN